MSRVARAWKALTTPDQAMAVTPSPPRAGGNRGPYRSANRDNPMPATIAPPGARQQWQLHRVREESRDLELRSPIWGGYVRFSRIQALGYELARLQFDRLTAEQKARLQEPIRYIRGEWNRFQTIRGVGGTGRSIHQMAGSALHHVDVDGDCFLMGNRTANGMRVWDFYPGDALSEADYRIGANAGRRGLRQLGVEVDGHLKPIAYHFRSRGMISALNVEYTSLGTQGGDSMRVAANRVQHIRDMSGEITAVRGWPRCTQVIEDIARLDEWYGALVRSATMRAAIGILLEREGWVGAAEMTGAGAGGFSAQSIAQSAGETDVSEAREDVRPYQEFEANAGSMTELLPGFKPHPVPHGAPTAQEATAISMLERRISAALRTSPATLLGDYKGLSFSAGQLAHLQERQAIEDRQMMLAHQYYGPIYRDFLMSRWVKIVSLFPELKPADLDALLYPSVLLKKYQILDKAKMTKPILDAWGAGMLTYAEARQELGFVGADVDATIAEWKENRRALGLPEKPSEGGGMSEPPGDDGDDGDEKDEDDDGES